jgi:hypothetical protein
MTLPLDELRELVRFRANYHRLTWDQIGSLFRITGTEAREQWLIATERREAPSWWRAARDLRSEGMGYRRIGGMLGRDKMAVKFAIRQMEAAQ